MTFNVMKCSASTCSHSRTRGTACTKPRVHTRPINCNTISQKNIMMPYMAQQRYPLNIQFLAIFFPLATIPATRHYPEFTDRYSPQYGKLSFSLYFMTHTFFRLSFLHFHLDSQSRDWSSPVYAPPPWPHWQKFSGPNPQLPPAIHLIYAV